MTTDLNPEEAVNAKRPRKRRTVLFWLALMTGVLVLFVGYRLATLPELRPPFDVASFVSVSIPDDQNAFTYYRQAKDRFVEASAVVPDSESPAGFMEELEANIENGWSKADEPVQKWLQLNQPALEVWKRGTECPDGMEMPPGTETIGNRFCAVSQSHRELARMALLQASRTAAEKRPPRRGPGIGPCSAPAGTSAGMSETIGPMIGVAIHSDHGRAGAAVVKPAGIDGDRFATSTRRRRGHRCDDRAATRTHSRPNTSFRAKRWRANTAGLSGLPSG